MGPIFDPTAEDAEEKRRKVLAREALASDEFKGFKDGYAAGYRDARYGHTLEATDLHVEMLFLERKQLTWSWDRSEIP